MQRSTTPTDLGNIKTKEISYQLDVKEKQILNEILAEYDEEERLEKENLEKNALEAKLEEAIHQSAILKIPLPASPIAPDAELADSPAPSNNSVNGLALMSTPNPAAPEPTSALVEVVSPIAPPTPPNSPVNNINADNPAAKDIFLHLKQIFNSSSFLSMLEAQVATFGGTEIHLQKGLGVKRFCLPQGIKTIIELLNLNEANINYQKVLSRIEAQAKSKSEERTFFGLFKPLSRSKFTDQIYNVLKNTNPNTTISSLDSIQLTYLAEQKRQAQYEAYYLSRR